MNLEISFEYEKETGRWIADLAGIPNTHPIHVYGNTRQEAATNVKLAALQTLIWAVEDGEITELNEILFSEAVLAA